MFFHCKVILRSSMLPKAGEKVTFRQRKGMDLLENQAMPFLRDVAYDGVLCTFSNR